MPPGIELSRRAANKQGRKLPYRKPVKLKPRTEAIAEMIATDATRERWYLNTDGRKLHVPRSGLGKVAFFGLLRMRLIGYPFWSRFTYVHWYSVIIAAIDGTLIFDHYCNGGRILANVSRFLSDLSV